MDTETVIYIVVEVIIAVMSVVCNSLVCWVIQKSNRLRQKAMYIFIASLAVADVLVGLLAIPFGILTKLGYPYALPDLCIVMLSFILIPTATSTLNLTGISIERYIAICHHVYHRNKLTPRVCAVVNALIWTVSAIIGMLPLMGWNVLDKTSQTFGGNHGFNGSLLSKTENSSFASTTSTTVQPQKCLFMEVIDFDYLFFFAMVCFAAPLLLTVVMYWVLFRAVSKVGASRPGDNPGHGHVKVSYSDPGPSYNYGTDISVSVTNTSHLSMTDASQAFSRTDLPSASTTKKRRRKSRRSELRVASILSITVLCFAVCWLPMHVLNTIFRFDRGRTVHIPTPVFSVAILLSHANSTVNFFLYSWRLNDFRKELHRLVLKRFQKS